MSWSATSSMRALAGVLALGTLLAGCSDIYYDRRDTIALSAGDALASDRAILTVDPWPPASNDRNIRFNGDKMQAAAARYRTGKVIPPKSMQTSSATTQSQSAPADPPPPQ